MISQCFQSVAPLKTNFHRYPPFRPIHFTDGMSNTLAMSEVKAYTNRISGGSSAATYPATFPPPTSPTDLAGYSLAAFDPAKMTHSEWVDGKVHETGFTTVFTPNTLAAYPSGGIVYDVDFVTAGETSLGDTFAAVTSRSHHAGGVNALFMDGSVHFINNDISRQTWRSLGTRAGGD